MSYPATVYNVLISHPSDVVTEPGLAVQAIHEWNMLHSVTSGIVLLPLDWKTHARPAAGGHPQALINEQLLNRCDILVGVFWTRLGKPTKDYASGSAEEIEKHIAAGRPTMLYFSQAPVVASSVDHEQYQSLEKFKASCNDRTLYSPYDTPAEFREKFFQHLQMTINQDDYFAESRRSSSSLSMLMTSAPGASLSAEAKTVLINAAKDKGGVVFLLHHLGGTDLQANGMNFIGSQDRREVAKWEHAIDQLASEGLIIDRNGKGEYFMITKDGYDVAETLES